MPTHLCLVSRQPLANLLGVLALRPTDVVFLTTDAEDRVRTRLASFLKRQHVAPTALRVDPYDPDNVRHSCRHVLDKPPSSPVLLNATGGTKVAALAAVGEFQKTNAEVFYVNTNAQRIQWLVPENRPADPLGVQLDVRDYLEVHGFTVSRSEQPVDVEARRTLSRQLAQCAARAEPVMRYFRRLYYAVTDQHLSPDRALAKWADDFPPDPGLVQHAVLGAVREAGMIRWDGEQVVGVRSPEDLRYLGGGRWLEEYTYLTLRDLGLDDVRANLFVRWGDRGTAKEVENELDVVATHRSRLYIFSCKTGGAVHSDRKDDLAQDEVFKLETLRELAGGAFARAVLVAGSRITKRLKARCGRLGIRYVDANDLHRLGELVRQVIAI